MFIMMRMKYLRFLHRVITSPALSQHLRGISLLNHGRNERGLPGIVRLFSGDKRSHQTEDERNIILMGCPGCGKTTVGGLLSQRLDMPQVDIDNDHLEVIWKTSVANKLLELGDRAFLEEEGKALLLLNVSRSIISLTGSNPLHKAAMTNIKRLGTVVYLDVPLDGILKRLHEMKTDRIVGLGEGDTIESVLRYRTQFYEQYYDVRVLVTGEDTCSDIAEKVNERLIDYNSPKKYVSTRQSGTTNEDEQKSFVETTVEGFAQDSGLFVPAFAAPLSPLGVWGRLVDMDYPERAQRILEQWINTKDIAPSVLRNMITNAYSGENFNDNRVCPVKDMGNNQYVVELFHGPTASFKDLALQLMPQFFQYAVNKTPTTTNDGYKKHLILVATSGDTGGAVADGFARHAGDAGIGVMVLYPKVGVSTIQKAQMCAMNGPKTRVVGVNGDFDFCQSTIKHVFSDTEINNKLKQDYNCSLSAANSINWARLLPQVVYHCSAYLDLVAQNVVQLGESVDYCIPTGNFGNMLAAYYAKKMGIPFGRLIIASNANNVVSEFIQTGRYDLRSRSLYRTASPAIDILKSSNVERYLWHVLDHGEGSVRDAYISLNTQGFFEVSNEVLGRIQRDFTADWCTEDDCLNMIKSTYTESNYLLDPHTAVAKVVADRFQDKDRVMLIAATAHYGKFADVVLSALGKPITNQTPTEMLQALSNIRAKPEMHERLSQTVSSPKDTQEICEASLKDVVTRIQNFVQEI